MRRRDDRGRDRYATTGEWDAAIDNFVKAADYSDAAERAEECRLLRDGAEATPTDAEETVEAEPEPAEAEPEVPAEADEEEAAADEGE